MREAIANRQAAIPPPVDTGSRFGWKEINAEFPSAGIDRDGESVYLRFPNAIKSDHLVSSVF